VIAAEDERQRAGLRDLAHQLPDGAHRGLDAERIDGGISVIHHRQDLEWA
jgi:hypothetical protein